MALDVHKAEILPWLRSNEVECKTNLLSFICMALTEDPLERGKKNSDTELHFRKVEAEERKKMRANFFP